MNGQLAHSLSHTPRSPHRGLRVLRLALLGLVPALAAAEDPSAEVIVLRRCPIGFERTAAVGSPMHGVVKDCLVQPGDRVKAGQVLGRLDDGEVRAQMEIRQAEAESVLGIRLNEAKLAQAQSKLRATASLLRRNAASQEEFSLHKSEAEVAAVQVQQAKRDHDMAQLQLRLAQAAVRAREFVSPYDGVVTAILKRKGEPVAPNEPIYRVVDLESLEVTGQVDVTDAWRLRPGQPVRIIPEIAGADLAIEREVFEGKLVFVDALIDPLTKTCKITARAENRGGLLRGGMEARLEILPVRPEDAAAKPAKAGPAPRPAPGVGQLERVRTLEVK